MTQLLSRDDLATHDADVWSYVSPSRLNLWLKCPLAFRLKYVDGEELPVSKPQFIGRRVHVALEHYYRRRQLGMQPTRTELICQMNDDWQVAVGEERELFRDHDDECSTWNQVLELVVTYLDQAPADEPRPLAVETAVEAPLVDPITGESLGIPLVGVVDLVLDEPTGPLIADFKTTKRGGEIAEITHEVQLTSYAYLFRHASNRQENALEIRNLVKTKMPKIETHRFGGRCERHLKRLFAVIRAYLDALDSGNFFYRPGIGCGGCEFRDTHCHDWQG